MEICLIFLGNGMDHVRSHVKGKGFPFCVEISELLGIGIYGEVIPPTTSDPLLNFYLLFINLCYLRLFRPFFQASYFPPHSNGSRAAKAGPKFLVPARQCQRTNQRRTLFICTL
jgi:hypothetical protein